jgi:hypothetical protein
VKRSVRLLAIFTLVMLAASVAAFADSDPTMIIGDPICGAGCTQIPSDNFSFGITGNVSLTFQNDSGDAWGALLLYWDPGEPIADVNVQFGPGFSNWSDFKFDNSDSSQFGITDPNAVGVYLFCVTQTTCDIPSGDSGTFNLTFAPDDGGNWMATDFNGQGRDTVPVPEPSFPALFFATVGALAACKKWGLLPTFS